jgi:hypothetical protein
MEEKTTETQLTRRPNMRPRTIASIVAVIMVCGVLPTPIAAATRPVCTDVIAKAWTAAIDKGVEVGEIAGLLNGAIYMRYDVKDPRLELSTSRSPNVVITTKTGNLSVWMSITSVEQPDGGYVRSMRTLRATGTGEFARASINIAIDGEYYPGEGGEYEVLGAICKPNQ